MLTAVMGMTLVHSGKVRDTYALPAYNEAPPLLLPVASDRISTHNVIHDSLIQGKGELLTALTHYWSRELMKQDIPSHIYASGVLMEPYVPRTVPFFNNRLYSRALVVRKLTMIPVEFVYRNVLAGSLYKAYAKDEDPYGLFLRSGLDEMHMFAMPIFTPTDKSATDNPLDSRTVRHRYPEAYELGLRVFTFMTEHLGRKGLTLLDSKFEFGVDEHGTVFLADEFGTMDSSRCIRTEDFGAKQPHWLDKQYYRQYVEALVARRGGPITPHTFPDEVVYEGQRRMRLLFSLITGMTLHEYQKKELM
jgi:phosphoribosylaminoimidazole-succinocarboxamide synthase